MKLKRFASNQWAIISTNGHICYGVARTKREAIAAFMANVNSDPKRRNLKWNCKELKYALAVKVKLSIQATEKPG